ncbi:MAG: DUF5011 domain-containing protein [Candidatus Hydrogenedentes bacterium]|nr:DUF5011 domain-containing protein [Candidatus Hydrogenedentota bacterium]
MRKRAVILLILLTAFVPTALARTAYLTNAKAKYPSITGTKLDSCTLCHNSPFDGSRNPYGADLLTAGLDFAAIETADSDGDGASNKDEIVALFFPGDASDTPPAAPADTTPPVLTVLGSNPVHIAQNAVYSDAGATAVDNVDGNITAAIVVTGSVDTAVPATYTINYSVQDAAGNPAAATRTVIVDPASGTDTTPPVITVLGSNPVHVAQNAAYTDAGATANDNVDGDITAAIVVTGSVDTAVPATYTINYSVQDAAGNPAAAARTVIVDPTSTTDTVPPVLTVLGANPAHVAQNAAYTDAGATAVDNVDGDITAAITVTGSVDTAVPGSYTLHYRVQDAAGNVSEATRAVVVDSPTPPPAAASELTAQLVAVGDDQLASGRARYENEIGDGNQDGSHDGSGDGDSNDSNSNDGDSNDGNSNDGDSNDSDSGNSDKSSQAESKLVVEVRGVLSTETVEVRLNGEIIGTASVEEGRARFELKTEHGDTVPAVQNGDLIEVLRSEDQAVLLSGNFAGEADDSHAQVPRQSADVNLDGVYSFADLREVALAALGEIQSIYDVDLDHNGVVDVADVQLALNAGCGFVDHYFSGEIARNARMEAHLEVESDSKSGLHGKANYGNYQGHRSLRLELEGTLGVAQVEVTVDGKSLGTVNVTGNHAGAVWDTRHGDTVPELHDGSTIEVADAATHTVLVSGQFEFRSSDSVRHYLEFYNADVNADGRVDAADILIAWAASLGQNVGAANADVDGDGSVDQADVEIVTLVAAISGCGESCDIDSDGQISALDIQQVVNSALNLDRHPEDADVDGDGGVDAVDIQLVISKALNL